MVFELCERKDGQTAVQYFAACATVNFDFYLHSTCSYMFDYIMSSISKPLQQQLQPVGVSQSHCI